MSNQHSKLEQTGPFDAVIVGAAFAGIYMLHRLRGMGFSVRVLEVGSGVGGTWYWNRYPGALRRREQYSYQFSEEMQRPSAMRPSRRSFAMPTTSQTASTYTATSVRHAGAFGDL